MKSPALNVLILIGSIALVSLVTLKLFRLYIRFLGMEKVMAEGVVLGETAVEFPRVLFLGIGRINYEEIESVELVRFPATLLLGVRYGKPIRSAVGPSWRTFVQDMVVIKLKPPRLVKYYTFNPINPQQFYQGLITRLEQFDAHGAILSHDPHRTP
jgi:hypothetical protein